MADVEDAGALRAEVERLRAANEALERQVSWRRTGRRAGVASLLVLGCGLAILSVLAIWLRVTLLDTNRYVDTVAPIAAQPDVQKAVAEKLNAAIDKRVDLDSLVQRVLPSQADAVAPALTLGLRSAIHSRVEAFTQSDRFQEAWTEANRRGHARLVELLTVGKSKRLLLQGDTVYLDFGPAVQRVKDELRGRGFDRLADAIPDDVDGQIPLVSSPALADAQQGVKLLKAVAIVLPLLALLCLAGSVALSRPWRRGLLRVAIGVVISMVVLVALVAVGRSAYLDALGNGALPRDAASTIFDTVASLLRDGVRIVVLVAVLVAVLTLLAGMPLRRVTEAAGARLATDRRLAWVAGHQRALQVAVVCAGALALLLWSPLTGGVVVLVLVIAAVAIALLAAVGAGRASLTSR